MFRAAGSLESPLHAANKDVCAAMTEFAKCVALESLDDNRE